ncbi:cupin domain-containing protein [Parachryseolinea silvisoli]|uniref:cupin domain-containing protein n=1 Tax=Parachryseolinea silvisoli TaxID=2873601 RepID=UPI0022659E53|nr:cupin domain-containing protein [Parachryseolinea silvisoli]MCD9016707.1 cupin domain-containing protein [Parachryseolinea silvisoli]
MKLLVSMITTFGLSTFLFSNFANAQAPKLGRTELIREDLSIPGREVVQVRVDIAPDTKYPRHSHPGEEIIYVITGSLEYTIDGRAPVTLTTGDVYFIPAGAIHTVKNVGTDQASELATYIVDKSKPLLSISK